MPRLDGHELPYFYRDVRDAHIGKLSDSIGRKPILIVVALFTHFLQFYPLMRFLTKCFYSSYDWRRCFWFGINSCTHLYGRNSGAENRGKLVATAIKHRSWFLCSILGHYYNKYYTGGAEFLTDENVWRWMLGVEALPALLYFVALFFVLKPSMVVCAKPS